MKITEIAFTAYPVKDMKRARAFYENVLGLTPTFINDSSHEVQWVEYDIGSGTLALGCSPDWEPTPQGCSAGLEVEDFELACVQLKEANAPFAMGPLETPVCQMVIVLDPEGNSIIIHKRKPGHP